MTNETDSGHDRHTSPWLHVWDDDKARALAMVALSKDVPARVPREPLPPGVLAPWWRAGARAAAFKPLQSLDALPATPAVIALLMLALMLASLLWERLAIASPAEFDWRALAAGWIDTAVLVWLCVWVRPPQSLGVARLVCLALGLQFVILSVAGPLWMLMSQVAWHDWPRLGLVMSWVMWGGPQLWWLLAMALLFKRLGDGHWRPWLLAVVVLMALLVLHWFAPVPRAWSAVAPPDEDQRPSLSITEAVIDAQSSLLDRQLAALKPQRPGVIDVYVLTFAPFGEEDVFKREAGMVADVMAQRFDAQGRTLQLVNHPATAEQLPWATSRNLARALQRIGQIMDPKEDVLFIHMTSHGASNGHLAAGLWPLKLEPVTPQALDGWLNAAGIGYRVISISACFSGSWIAPLSHEQSLVMTAADADHTSYGCGRRSPLTFFGRAMYDEQLRLNTRSFTQAHAVAREVIRQREIEAGKEDGYSNPQIKVGAKIVPVLEALEKRLAR